MPQKSDNKKIGEEHLKNAPLTADSEANLVRALNLPQTTIIGVGTALGGVMFAIMGRAVAGAGPSIVITFLIGAFFALIVGLSYAELGAAVPESAGGAISFVRRAFGDGIPTFMAGWFSWIGSITDAAIGSLVFSFSVQYFLPWIEPFSLAIITLVIVTLINFRGTRSMGAFQLVLTIALILTLCIFMTGSALNFNTSRFQPLFPYGILPTLYMVSFIFPTYAGYESITQLSEEVKIAGKTIPRALFFTLGLLTLLLTGSAVALIGGAPPEIFVNSDTPLQDAANYFLGPIGGAVVSLGSILAVLTTINGTIAGGTRIAFALGRSRMLPQLFTRVHPRYRSPYTALALTSIIAISFILTRSVDLIVYAITLGYSITAILVTFSLIRLRKKEPHLYRPFKVPLYPLTPIAAIGVLVFMLTTLSSQSLSLGLVLGITGLVLFVLTKKFVKNSSRVS